MTTQEILNSGLNKTQKGFQLYDLGHTRTQVSEWVTNGNYGFAHNIYKKWIDARATQIVALPFTFAFNRTFGIELEVYGVDRERLLNALRNEGVEVQGEGYNHTTRNHWKIVSDSSIQGGQGNEIVSPVLRGMDGIEQVKKVCIALNRAGAKVNKSCGFHVHIGAADYQIGDFKNLLTSHVHLETSFDKLQPDSRRGNKNQYCKNLSSVGSNVVAKIGASNQFSELSSVFGNGRYFKLNVQSFNRYGTVEFRHHSGTTTFSKVKNWILICSRLVEYAKQNGVTNNFNTFLNESLLDYTADRAVDLVA